MLLLWLSLGDWTVVFIGLGFGALLKRRRRSGLATSPFILFHHHLSREFLRMAEFLHIF
jgi:hypothetical protein